MLLISLSLYAPKSLTSINFCPGYGSYGFEAVISFESIFDRNALWSLSLQTWKLPFNTLQHTENSKQSWSHGKEDPNSLNPLINDVNNELN